MAETPPPRTLQDEDILNVGQKVTDYGTLRELAYRGLKLKSHHIESAITNKQNDIHSAANDLLHIWFKSQNDEEEAFRNLHTALEECQLIRLANELVKGTRKGVQEKPLTEILQDGHVQQLSEKITDFGDLRTLGYRGLKLEAEHIESAITNHPNDIQSAAHKVLTTWFQKQTTEEALGSLCKALQESELKGLSSQLRKWVEDSKDGSEESTFQIFFF